MTRTFNKETYANLLSQYQPKVITTEEENEAVIALAYAMEHRERTPEEDALLELLVALIEKFEDEHYQLRASTPHSILQTLMEDRNIKPSELVGILGAKASEVIDKKRSISKSQAQALGDFFHVSPALFL